MSNFLSILFKNMRGFIALIFVFGVIAFDFLLAFKAIPTENKELLYTITGGLNTVAAAIVNYYFGSSKDKSDQEKATIIENQNKP
jgi:hypothetical protein